MKQTALLLLFSLMVQIYFTVYHRHPMSDSVTTRSYIERRRDAKQRDVRRETTASRVSNSRRLESDNPKSRLERRKEDVAWGESRNADERLGSRRRGVRAKGRLRLGVLYVSSLLSLKKQRGYFTSVWITIRIGRDKKSKQTVVALVHTKMFITTFLELLTLYHV